MTPSTSPGISPPDAVGVDLYQPAHMGVGRQGAPLEAVGDHCGRLPGDRPPGQAVDELVGHDADDQHGDEQQQARQIGPHS